MVVQCQFATDLPLGGRLCGGSLPRGGPRLFGGELRSRRLAMVTVWRLTLPSRGLSSIPTEGSRGCRTGARGGEPAVRHRPSGASCVSRGPAVDDLAVADREASSARCPHWAFRESEAALSDALEFMDPAAAALKDVSIRRFTHGHEAWRRKPGSASPLRQPFCGQAVGRRRPRGRPAEGAEDRA
jgi:hypothetical protein